MQQAQGPGQYSQAPNNQPYGAQQAPVGGGGSFLGTAAAAAAGVVGGSLLLGSIRSMMGGGHQQSFGDTGGDGAAIAAVSKTAGPGPISPAAIWRRKPGSTTSDRQDGTPATMTARRARDCSIAVERRRSRRHGSGFGRFWRRRRQRLRLIDIRWKL